MRGMAAGEMDASAGACDSYAAGTGAKRLVPLSEPDIVMVGEDKARVWQPASCPAPDPGALEALAPKPRPSPPLPFPSRTDAPPPTALPKPKF